MDIENTDDLLVSGDAFKAMLSHVDPDTMLKKLKDDYASAKSISAKNNIVKRIKYLSGLKKLGTKPVNAFLLHNVPVVPPNVRPATVMGGNRLEFADVNYLYKDHMLINTSVAENKDFISPEMLTSERAANYNGLKAIMGLGEAISPNSRGRNAKGFLRQIAGEAGPKGGFFHSKILSKKQDFSARGTLYIEPNLEFNQTAIPEDMIWNTYKFHILRDLSKRGLDHLHAEKAWSERSTLATSAFNKMIKEVPIIINRAPTLMQSNVTAFYPVPVKGKSIGINPLMLPLFAADADGDALSCFVPMTPEAVAEAKTKLLPTSHIYDFRKGMNSSMVAPGHEAILGSVYMTEPDMTQKPMEFKTEEECLAALKRGEIKENTPVKILGK